jgi:hypothetical protein
VWAGADRFSYPLTLNAKLSGGDAFPPSATALTDKNEGLEIPYSIQISTV